MKYDIFFDLHVFITALITSSLPRGEGGISTRELEMAKHVTPTLNIRDPEKFAAHTPAEFAGGQQGQCP